MKNDLPDNHGCCTSVPTSSVAWSRRENVFWINFGLRFLRCLCVWGTYFQLVSLPSLLPRFSILWNDLCVFMGVVHPYQQHPLAWSRRENVFWINFGLRFLRRPCVWGTNFQLVGLQSLRPRFLIHGCCTSVPTLSTPRSCPENVFRIQFWSSIPPPSACVEGQISSWSVFNYSVVASCTIIMGGVYPHQRLR